MLEYQMSWLGVWVHPAKKWMQVMEQCPIGLKTDPMHFHWQFFVETQMWCLRSRWVHWFWHDSPDFHKGHTQVGVPFLKKVRHVEVHHHCIVLSKHNVVWSVFHMTEWWSETCDASIECNSNNHSTFCSTWTDHRRYSATLLVCWQWLLNWNIPRFSPLVMLQSLSNCSSHSNAWFGSR